MQARLYNPYSEWTQSQSKIDIERVLNYQREKIKRMSTHVSQNPFDVTLGQSLSNE